LNSINDGIVKSLKLGFFVIPAKAGIQSRLWRDFKDLEILWTPVSTGVTTFYEFINNSNSNKGGSDETFRND
jgi:hypothetical protein